MRHFIPLFTLLLIICFACGKDDTFRTNTYPDNYYTQQYGNPQIKNKVYEKDGRTYLWGGPDTLSHFDITGWSLQVNQLHFGLGREHFKALIEPAYLGTTDERIDLTDAARCLFVKGENSLIKVYPYKFMLEYEVINEVIDGEPIMVAYCVLADLGAAYTRRYCDQTLTFGVSGYTYYDPKVWGGLDGFVLWDRDTESLWWPLIDKGVSGSMQEVNLEKHNELKWGYATWLEIKSTYPQALVLAPGQAMDPPQSWNRIPAGELNCN